MTMSTQLNPLDLDGLGGDMWDHARREYLSGVKATTICQRYGMSLSSFRLHARVGGWRRMDQPLCEAPPEFGEYHPDDDVSFADLANQAFLNIRRAMGNGRAATQPPGCASTTVWPTAPAPRSWPNCPTLCRRGWRLRENR